jgi:hypothetical protein
VSSRRTKFSQNIGQEDAAKNTSLPGKHVSMLALAD